MTWFRRGHDEPAAPQPPPGRGRGHARRRCGDGCGSSSSSSTATPASCRSRRWSSRGGSPTRPRGHRHRRRPAARRLRGGLDQRHRRRLPADDAADLSGTRPDARPSRPGPSGRTPRAVAARAAGRRCWTRPTSCCAAARAHDVDALLTPGQLPADQVHPLGPGPREGASEASTVGRWPTMKRGANVALTREIPGLTGLVLGVRWNAGAETRARRQPGVRRDPVRRATARPARTSDFVFFNQLASPDDVGAAARAGAGRRQRADRGRPATRCRPRSSGSSSCSTSTRARRSAARSASCARASSGCSTCDDNAELVRSEDLAAAFDTETAVALGELYRHGGGLEVQGARAGLLEGHRRHRRRLRDPAVMAGDRDDRRPGRRARAPTCRSCGAARRPKPAAAAAPAAAAGDRDRRRLRRDAHDRLHADRDRRRRQPRPRRPLVAGSPTASRRRSTSSGDRPAPSARRHHRPRPGPDGARLRSSLDLSDPDAGTAPAPRSAWLTGAAHASRAASAAAQPAAAVHRDVRVAGRTRAPAQRHDAHGHADPRAVRRRPPRRSRPSARPRSATCGWARLPAALRRLVDRPARRRQPVRPAVAASGDRRRRARSTSSSASTCARSATSSGWRSTRSPSRAPSSPGAARSSSTTFGGARIELPLETLYAGPIAVLLSLYNLDGELVIRAEMETIAGDVREAARAYGYDRITWRDDRIPVD